MDSRIIYLEKVRKKAAQLTTIVISVTIAVIILGLILFINSGMGKIGITLAILIGIGVGIVLSQISGMNKSYKEYEDCFKKFLVEEPFRNSFCEIEFHHDKGFEKELIDQTDIIMMGNRYYTNDYVRGYYKDVQFERADVKIQKHTSNGKSSHTVTYFYGRWLIFEFNKNFHFDLQIISKGFCYSQHNSSFFTSEGERRHKIQLEDINFNETFNVYAQNDHEAFYILTPVFIETLKNMYRTMDGEFMLGFIDNRLHVAINTKKDAMEPRIYGKLDLNEIAQEVEKEIDTIIHIIDGLTLDRDLYKY